MDLKVLNDEACKFKQQYCKGDHVLFSTLQSVKSSKNENQTLLDQPFESASYMHDDDIGLLGPMQFFLDHDLTLVYLVLAGSWWYITNHNLCRSFLTSAVGPGCLYMFV